MDDAEKLITLAKNHLYVANRNFQGLREYIYDPNTLDAQYGFVVHKIINESLWAVLLVRNIVLPSLNDLKVKLESLRSSEIGHPVIADDEVEELTHYGWGIRKVMYGDPPKSMNRERYVSLAEDFYEWAKGIVEEADRSKTN